MEAKNSCSYCAFSVLTYDTVRYDHSDVLSLIGKRNCSNETLNIETELNE
jgi:hypothetical protein